jgi:hypothetical protein
VTPTSAPRTGWLRVIRVLLIVMLVGDLPALLLGLLPNGAVTVAHANLGSVIDPNGSGIHLRFPDLSLGEVSLLDARRPTYLEHLLYNTEQYLAFLAVSIPVILYALRTVNATLVGDPFTAHIVRRIRNLGLMVLVGGLLCEVVSYVAGVLLIDIALPRDELLRLDARPDWRPDLWWVLPAFILLVVSAFMRRGVELRAELDAVI